MSLLLGNALKLRKKATAESLSRYWLHCLSGFQELTGEQTRVGGKGVFREAYTILMVLHYFHSWGKTSPSSCTHLGVGGKEMMHLSGICCRKWLLNTNSSPGGPWKRGRSGRGCRRQTARLPANRPVENMTALYDSVSAQHCFEGLDGPVCIGHAHRSVETNVSLPVMQPHLWRPGVRNAFGLRATRVQKLYEGW